MPFSGIWHSILGEADQLTGPELHFHSIAQPHLVYFYQNRDSVNNVTGDQNDDRSITVHFDGYPDQPNFFYTPENWAYLIRFYQPHKEAVNGRYQLPKPQPIK